MNYADSDRIRTVLQNAGHKEIKDLNKADIIIFVTCSVKQKAEDKVIGHFHDLMKMKRRKRVQIGITGCMARITSNLSSEKKDRLLRRLKGLDFVFRIEEVEKLPHLLENEYETTKNNQDPISYFEITPSCTESFRAFVPIMNGCNKFCTYCIVPYARGREVSRKMSNIINEVKNLVKNGCREITLLGQNVNSYGRTNDVYDKNIQKNNQEDFVRLLTEVGKIPGQFRIRFTSSHPQDMSDEVIETICSLKKLCNHVHLPLQSGDDEVLKKMNRSYTYDQFKKMIKKFRKHSPDIAISTDIIVGFCGETEEQFQNTIQSFKELQFDLAYISQYSERKGTYAEKNLEDDISRKEKIRRFHKLNNLLKEISLAKNQTYLGKKIEILIENTDKKAKTATGKTSCYKTVQVPLGDLKPGDFTKVHITDAKEWILYGELVSEMGKPRKIQEKNSKQKTTILNLKF